MRVVEKYAGVGSWTADDDYAAPGAKIIESAVDVWGAADKPERRGGAS